MTVSTTQLTPLSFLERAARVHADRTAVVHGERRLTYTDFRDAVVTMARALRSSGVEPGDRVAFLMPNLPEMLMAHYAAPSPAPSSCRSTRDCRRVRSPTSSRTRGRS